MAWVHWNDVRKLVRKIRQGKGRQLLSKLIPGANRVQASWSHTSSPVLNCWDLPQIQSHWNFKVTGDPELSPRIWIAETFLAGKDKLTGLSVGCGTGTAEIEWAKTGIFSKLEAIDLSPERIFAATHHSQSENLGNILNFRVAEFLSDDKILEKVDVIIFEGALHHFDPVSDAVEKAKNLLKPGGFLVLNEYAGPNRFQWHKNQLEAINRLLIEIPSELRTFRGGGVKKKVYRPGVLTMWLSDPSEAPDSESIRMSMTDSFERVVVKNYGGTLLQPLFDEIGGNFLNKGHEFVRLVINEEEKLLSAGNIESDFFWGVWKKKK
ncbi:MAG: class I SAM-dependent methyltransferase [Bacteroidetes bacterium]|nr:class I SAM-dependent methyltransferase [Bacteroidota bacterium]